MMDSLKISEIELTYGPKRGWFFRRINLPEANWCVKFDFHPRTRPCFTPLSAPICPERNAEGHVVVPLTADVSASNLSHELLNAWWDSVTLSHNAWSTRLTNGLASTFGEEVRRRQAVLEEIEGPGIATVIGAEIAAMGPTHRLVTHLAVLRRIHLSSWESSLECSYGFSTAWNEDHEINLLYRGDAFVRAVQGR